MDSTEEDAANLGINWTFNPVGAPNFGVVWERLVRSSKKAMWNNLASQSVKEEQLTTIICSVEQQLHNKPLIACNNRAAELEELTPNHFRLGQATIDYPNVVINGESAAIKKAFWAHSQQMMKIWDTWMEENLTQWTTRKKRAS